MGVTVLTLSWALQWGFLGEGQRASGALPHSLPDMVHGREVQIVLSMFKERPSRPRGPPPALLTPHICLSGSLSTWASRLQPLKGPG